MFGTISAIGNTVSTIITRIWPDATEAERAKLALLSQELEQEFKVQLGQIEVNIEQAKHKSLLVSGSRPFIIWVGGIALLYSAVIEPIARFIAVVVYHYTGEFPMIDTDITFQILMGLLGFGGYRTVEKIKRVNGDHR